MSEKKIGEEYVISESLYENLYMRGFLSDLYLRPSCHVCPSKSLRSGSDITLADFWGVENVLPDFDDNIGVSLVILHNQKAINIYQQLNAQSIEVDETALKYNCNLLTSVKQHRKRAYFFRRFKCGKYPLLPLIEKMLAGSTLWDKIEFNVKRYLRKFRLIK